MRGLREHVICRLCLSTGCRLSDILQDSRNDEFVVKQAVEDLLQLVVLKEALYPWLVCSICLEKLREFHFFKRSCVENQEVYDSRIRGNNWPVNQVRSTECDDIPVKSEEGNAVEDPLHPDAFKNVDSDHSNQPQTTVAVKCEEGGSTWESLDLDSHNPTDCNSFEVSQSATGHGSDFDVNVHSEKSDEGDVQDKDQYSSECNRNSDSEVSVKVEQSNNEDNVKEDETFVCEGDDSKEPEVGDVSIHGMEVECSGIEQHGAGYCVTEKGQEAVAQQECMSGYTPSPFFAEGSNTDSNTASGCTDASRMRTQSAMRGSGRGISKDRCGSSSFFGQQKVKLTLSCHIRAHQSRRDNTLAAKEQQGQENENGTKFPRSNYEEVFGTCCELGSEGFICVHCGKACTRKAQLISHIRSHNGHLSSHMRTHDGKRPFECEVCNKKFSRKDKLSGHMRTHDGKRPFECEVCKKKFSRKDKLSDHMRTHDGKRPFECEVCNKKLSRKDKLSDHMRTHDGKRPFECEVCKKKFSRKDNLREHMRTHDGKRPFECEVCNKKFSQSGNLSKHMRTHDGKRPFECEVCNKKFSQNGNLSKHMRTHDGKRPFECEVCKKKFSRKDNLGEHMRTHDGKRPFECEVCNKKFSQSGNLSKHMRTHDVKRPFDCKVCNKKFSLRGNLSKHMRTHDGKRPFV